MKFCTFVKTKEEKYGRGRRALGKQSQKKIQDLRRNKIPSLDLGNKCSSGWIAVRICTAMKDVKLLNYTKE
jgi:hypothetical protein